MAKNTMGIKLPRKLEQKLQIAGEQIKLARLRRNLSIAQVAERATCSPLTVSRVEKGLSTVSIGIYLRVLYALQLDDDILWLAKEDPMGKALQDLNLKQREELQKKIIFDDFSRMGGFRFKENPDDSFINSSNDLRIPPLTSIRELLHASQQIEKSEEQNILPDKKWLFQLIQPGTSLGGARPKASVVDENEVLHIVKFPSRKDDTDVSSWEHFAHLLATQCSIRAAETKVITTDSANHTLLSRRFDRTEQGKRIHFASAMTLLGLADGDNSGTGHGYLDIVDFIIQHCTNVEANLQEL